MSFIPICVLFPDKLQRKCVTQPRSPTSNLSISMRAPAFTTGNLAIVCRGGRGLPFARCTCPLSQGKCWYHQTSVLSPGTVLTTGVMYAANPCEGFFNIYIQRMHQHKCNKTPHRSDKSPTLLFT